MSFYLTNAAEEDITNIISSGASLFGVLQAKAYHASLGSEDLKLEFDVPIDLAIERLNASVVRPSFSLLKLKSQKMVGKVSKNNVEIQRFIPHVRNSFSPVLMGSFSVDGNKTILSGLQGASKH